MCTLPGPYSHCYHCQAIDLESSLFAPKNVSENFNLASTFSFVVADSPSKELHWCCVGSCFAGRWAQGFGEVAGIRRLSRHASLGYHHPLYAS